MRIPLGSPPPLGSLDAPAEARLDETTFRKAHYTWMLRDNVAQEIMRLARELIESFLQAAQRGLLSVFPRRAAASALAEIGTSRKMPQLYGEGLAAYRSRLMSPFDWHSAVGREGLILRAMSYVNGGGNGGYYIAAFEPGPEAAYALKSLAIYESESAAKWLIRRVQSGTEEFLYYSAASEEFIVCELTDSDSLGFNAETAASISDSALSALLPCQELGLVALFADEDLANIGGVICAIESEYLV